MFKYQLTNFTKTHKLSWIFPIYFKGETGSWGTGPKADHTLGNEQGSYLYVETSYAKENDTANLQSPLISFSGSQPSTVCVRFWYHMFGQHVGAFNIYQSTKAGVAGKLVWQRKGSLVDEWVYGHVSVQRSPSFYVSNFEIFIHSFCWLLNIIDITFSVFLENHHTRHDNTLNCIKTKYNANDTIPFYQPNQISSYFLSVDDVPSCPWS